MNLPRACNRVRGIFYAQNSGAAFLPDIWHVECRSGGMAVEQMVLVLCQIPVTSRIDLKTNSNQFGGYYDL
jgi:hypothetical protein